MQLRPLLCLAPFAAAMPALANPVADHSFSFNATEAKLARRQTFNGRFTFYNIGEYAAMYHVPVRNFEKKLL